MDLPDSDQGDFNCRRAVDSSSFRYEISLFTTEPDQLEGYCHTASGVWVGILQLYKGCQKLLVTSGKTHAKLVCAVAY